MELERTSMLGSCEFVRWSLEPLNAFGDFEVDKNSFGLRGEEQSSLTHHQAG